MLLTPHKGERLDIRRACEIETRSDTNDDSVDLREAAYVTCGLSDDDPSPYEVSTRGVTGGAQAVLNVSGSVEAFLRIDRRASTADSVMYNIFHHDRWRSITIMLDDGTYSAPGSYVMLLVRADGRESLEIRKYCELDL